MSMNNYSCHGYTVRALILADLIPNDKGQRDQFLGALKDHDVEEAQNIMDDELDGDLPLPFLFLMGDEWESEDLERGEIYASWDQEELYELVPLTALELLKQKNVNPELNRWVSWG